MAVNRSLIFLVFFTVIFYLISTHDGAIEPFSLKHFTLMISVLVRNKEHTLPYFLTGLERLQYPKDRIALWIRSDHNVDRSTEALEKWLSANSRKYHSVNVSLSNSPSNFTNEEGIADWTHERYSHVIALRQEALDESHRIWADFLWMLDSDVLITDTTTIQLMIDKGHTVVAPMLLSEGLYSNFWCGMSSSYYYQRTEDYEPIVNRRKTGCFHVPMVHSSVFIDLRAFQTDGLTYSPRKIDNYDGPHDDIIAFAISANQTGIKMYVCNERKYGYLPAPLEKGSSLNADYMQLRNIKMEVLVDGPPLEVNRNLTEFIKKPEPSPLPVNKTYMISLQRRPERRTRMLRCFEELDISAVTVDAVDGRVLTDDELKRRGVKLLPGYKDPYKKRPMKRGEIGCFLSHYGIWKEVAESNYTAVLVLEDDVRFEPYFNQKLSTLIEETESLRLSWDLVYLGRKRLQETPEAEVEGSNLLVHAGYSYWTLGYLLSGQGARKLLAPDPLQKVLPVDEYLPIMYDDHPEEEWKSHFPVRNLNAFSADPLLVYPAKYLHEEGYISDTEDSPTIATTTTPSPEL